MEMVKRGEWLELTVDHKWEDWKIDSILKEDWKVPKKLLHQLRMDKGVRLNGVVKPWITRLHIGDILHIHLFKKEEYGAIPNMLDVTIIYEDDHVLVANKPAGMDTHPSSETQKDTLVNAIAYHWLSHGIETKVRHIHRLDRDTTGAVLFAKHALSAAILDRMLEKRIIKRTYLALVHGKLKKRQGTIHKPVGRDRHHQSKRRVSDTGQDATTEYEVVEYDSKTNQSLIRLQLETGRTHQIRVHMSYIGHPIIGDKLYGGSSAKGSHQALHAARIDYPHPITGELCKCIAPFLNRPPIFRDDMLNVIKPR